MYLDRVRALTYLQTATLCRTNYGKTWWRDLDPATISSMSGVPESNIVVHDDGSVTLTPPLPESSSFPTMPAVDPFLWEPSSYDAAPNQQTRGGSLYYDPTSAPTAASVPYYVTANTAALDMLGQQRSTNTNTNTSTTKWKPRPNLLFSLSSTSSSLRRDKPSSATPPQDDNNIITDDTLDTLLLRMQLTSLPPGIDREETPEPLMYDTFFISSK